jgi:hypothetical protein
VTYLTREVVKTLPKGDWTGAFVSVWNAAFRAIVTREAGLQIGLLAAVVAPNEETGEGHLPHAVGWVDQEPTNQTGHAITNKVGRETNQDLVRELAGIALVKIRRKILDPDDIVGIGVCRLLVPGPPLLGPEPELVADGRLTVPGNISHDGDQHVLLLGKPAGVQTVSNATKREANIGKGLLGELAQGIGEQLRNVGLDQNIWLAN